MENKLSDQENFDKWYEILEKKTVFLSATHSIQAIQEYKNIAELNTLALPMIINRLEMDENYSICLINLLLDITGECPVPIEHQGIIKLVTEDWIQWWYDKP